MSRHIDFIVGLSPQRQKKSKKLSLCYAHPKIEEPDDEAVIQKVRVDPRSPPNTTKLSEDGLYVSSDGPLTFSVVKPYQLGHQRGMDMQPALRPTHKLLEIAVREVKITQTESQRPLEITSVFVLFKEKTICKISSPFNRKLYKLLVNNSSEPCSLSLRVQSRDGACSDLPFPLPARCVRDKLLEIDFSINDSLGAMYSGTLVCTVSLSLPEDTRQSEPSTYVYKSTNDPNDPQNGLSLLKVRRNIRRHPVKYFLLEDPALRLPHEVEHSERVKQEPQKLPDIVVLEQPVFSLWDISFGNWLQARRPLRPSSGTGGPKFRGGRDEVLTITVLRGVEVPVREESALVQPLVQIQWGELVQSTSASEGASPVWQQSMHFGIPRRGREAGVKLLLYDQHPVWGLQWLGEALIPLEFHRNYQELERWVGLSPLSSPVVRFGYVQASPTRSYTRIYILMRMERLANGESSEMSSLDNLSKAIQRCMVVPYKVPGTETTEDAARLAMLLTPLPAQYGPLTPKQALKLNKIDHYGRAALLATLLQGFGVDAYVLIGSSQARNWAAFVVSVNEKGENFLWDPENGDQYNFGDSRCSIIKVLRIINHQNIWKNLQKTSIVSNLKFNPKVTKDWQPLGSSSSAAVLEAQTLEVDVALRDPEEDKDAHLDIETQLKDRLSEWRSRMGFTTVFNRHAMSVLRTFLTKLSDRVDGQVEKKDLKQLYRAYHIHGFVLNLRWSPIDELVDLFASTRIQEVTGPVEFALVCHLQRYVGKTSSLWLAVVILRSRD